MVCTHIYSFLASEGKYLEPATSLHPIKVEGYEIHLDFISLVRELTLVEGLSVLANRIGKAVVQAPCQQLSWKLGYLKRLVMFCLLPVVQDY
jgi:hypothetical protein